MELNRDQIIEALGCCGGDIIECQKCAYRKNGYNKCKEGAAQDARALIKKLTAQNDQFRYEQRKLIEQRDTFREYAENMQKFIEFIKHYDAAGYQPSAARYAAEMDMWNVVALEKKRLTEENERLHASCMELTQECKKWQSRIKIECEYTEKITVRKMQEMLCEGRVSNDPVVIATNVVAKEMLEDGNG